MMALEGWLADCMIVNVNASFFNFNETTSTLSGQQFAFYKRISKPNSQDAQSYLVGHCFEPMKTLTISQVFHNVFEQLSSNVSHLGR